MRKSEIIADVLEYFLLVSALVLLLLFFRLIPGDLLNQLTIPEYFVMGALFVIGGVVQFFLKERSSKGSLSLGKVLAIIPIFLGILILFFTYVSNALIHSGGL